MKRRGFLSLLAASPLLNEFGLTLDPQPPPTPFELWGDRHVYRVPLPFAPMRLVAGQIGFQWIRPQRLVLPEQLIVGSATAHLHTILGLTTSGEAALDQALPAMLFSETSWLAEPLKFHPVSPGEHIGLVVRNDSAEPLEFRAMLTAKTERF